MGNRALQRLAAVMKEHCRSTDLVVRFGGDEFAVVLTDSDRGIAKQVAQRIENGLRNDQGRPSVSVSIGVGTYPDGGRAASELIEAADQQLYKHKKTEDRPTLPRPNDSNQARFALNLRTESSRATRQPFSLLPWYSAKEHGQMAMVLFTVPTWLNPCVGLAL